VIGGRGGVCGRDRRRWGRRIPAAWSPGATAGTSRDGAKGLWPGNASKSSGGAWWGRGLDGRWGRGGKRLVNLPRRSGHPTEDGKGMREAYRCLLWRDVSGEGAEC